MHHASQSDDKLRRFALALVLGNIFIVALLSVAALLALKSGRQTDETMAIDAAQNVASALAAEVSAELRQIDNALLTVRSAYHASVLDSAGRARLEQVLREQLALLTHAEAIRITDADGTVQLGLPDGAPRLNVADREYFSAAREREGAVISEPLQSRVAKKWGVILARRLDRPDGRFAGVVYAYVPSERFATRFSSLKIGSSGAVWLRSKDLRLIARHAAQEPLSDKGIGTSHAPLELTEALATNPLEGRFISIGLIDGVERASAYRKVPPFDLTVLVGLATQDFLAPWRKNVQNAAAMLLGVAIVMVTASLALWSQRRRHALAQTQIAQLVRQQTLMLDNELIGMARLQNRRALWVNRALEKMFGYEPGELDGKPARLIYTDDESYERIGGAYRSMHADGRFRTQLWMQRKDGSRIWVDLSGAPISDEQSQWMFVDATAMKGTEEQLKKLALHDPLTGLANRALFADKLAYVLAHAQRNGSATAVCYIDLDGFKAVNDRLGHAAGDEVLVEVSRRLLACVRADDVVSRLGGDEFALILANLYELSQIKLILDRVLVSLRQPILLSGGTATVGASIGVALAPEQGTQPDLLMRLADQSMYEAKRAGKNCIKSAAHTPLAETVAA